MAMMTGMRIISVDHGIAMRGRAGIIASAVHTIFGTVMHYTPANVGSDFGLTDMGDISPNWMSRLWDKSPVAERDFDGRERALIERMEYKWLINMPTPKELEKSKSGNKQKERMRNVVLLTAPVTSKATIQSTRKNPAKSSMKNKFQDLAHGIHDGDWKFSTNMTKYGPSATSTYVEKLEAPPDAEFHQDQAPGTAAEMIKEDVSRRRVAEPPPVRLSKANEQAEGSKKEESEGEKYDEILEIISSLFDLQEQKPRRGSKPRHGSSLQLFVGDKSGLPRHNNADKRPIKGNIGQEKVVEGDSVVSDSEKEQGNFESTKLDTASSSRNNDVPAVQGQSNIQERLSKNQHGVSGITSIEPEAESHKFGDPPPADATTGSKDSREASLNTNDLKNTKKQPIYLKDAVGRKFTFPYHTCKT